MGGGRRSGGRGTRGEQRPKRDAEETQPPHQEPPEDEAPEDPELMSHAPLPDAESQSEMKKEEEEEEEEEEWGKLTLFEFLQTLIRVVNELFQRPLPLKVRVGLAERVHFVRVLSDQLEGLAQRGGGRVQLPWALVEEGRAELSRTSPLDPFLSEFFGPQAPREARVLSRAVAELGMTFSAAKADQISVLCRSKAAPLPDFLEYGPPLRFHADVFGEEEGVWESGQSEVVRRFCVARTELVTRKLEAEGRCLGCWEAVAGPDRLRCGRCRWALYCSKSCQKLDWGLHKRLCHHKASASATAPTDDQPNHQPPQTRL